MLSQSLRIEGKLHENVHLGGLLADDQLAVVRGRQLIQAEEAQVREDLVESSVIAIRASQVALKEHTGENLISSPKIED